MITQPFQDDVFFLLGWGEGGGGNFRAGRRYSGGGGGGGGFLGAGIRYSRGVLKGGLWAANVGN